MSRQALFAFWFVAALVWTAAVAYFGFQSMPHVPMDMSPDDPATKQALAGAMLKHVISYGGLAAVPPAIALGLIWLLGRKD